MLHQINLSLSSLCSADCIFCPANRGKRIEQKNMPPSYVKKIMDEITSNPFTQEHRVERISISQMGDAFLNKDIIQILRMIKSKAPHIKVIVYTNFYNMNKEVIDVIFKENLIDKFNGNFDASTDENYFQIKRLHNNRIKENLSCFLSLRRKYMKEVPLTIYILTLHDYVQTIYKSFKLYPLKLHDPKYYHVRDDFEDTKKELRKLLDKELDTIVRSSIVGWAEREQIDPQSISYKSYTCPQLNRMDNEAFIAPDGTWYACCLDNDNELVFGNVINDSIQAVYEGNTRTQLISMLKKRQFGQIKGPCTTVVCCQVLNKSKFNMTKMLLKQLIKGH